MLVSGAPKTKQTLFPIPNKVKEWSLANIDSWASPFYHISRPPFLCPISGHCVPERKGALVDLLGTLSKFLISLASVFLEENSTSLPDHRHYHYSDLHPSLGSPLTHYVTLGKPPAFSKPASSSVNGENTTHYTGLL